MDQAPSRSPSGNSRPDLAGNVRRSGKSECSLWEVMKLAAEKCRPRNLLIAIDPV